MYKDYLTCSYNKDLNVRLSKILLSYAESLCTCTLCVKHDVKDEYHIPMKCTYSMELRKILLYCAYMYFIGDRQGQTQS